VLGAGMLTCAVLAFMLPKANRQFTVMRHTTA